MSKGFEGDGSSQRRMRRADQLSWSLTGKEDLEIWKIKMRDFLKEFFGYLVDCLMLGKATPWMDPTAEFEYLDERGNAKQIPNKDRDVIKYNAFKEAMKNFGIKQEDYDSKKSTLTSVLFNGCLAESSRARLLEYN